MPGQQTCAPPVIVTLPAQLDAAAAEQAADQITAGTGCCPDLPASRPGPAAHRIPAAGGCQGTFWRRCLWAARR